MAPAANGMSGIRVAESAGKYDDRQDRQRKRAIVDEQAGQLANRQLPAYSWQSLRARAARQDDRRQPNGQEQRGKCDDREIRARPSHAETLSGPEDAERGQHHADGELERVFGNPRQRAMHDKPAPATSRHAASAPALAGTSSPRPALTRNHDEHHFKSFEKHGLEAGERSEPIEPRLVAAGLLAQFRRFGREGRGFIMQRDDAGGAQDRLSQPAHAEQQQQDTNRELQEMEGTRSRSGPSPTTMKSRTTRPASAPSPAGRQPRTVATASTMVRASTASTSEARNAAIIAGPKLSQGDGHRTPPAICALSFLDRPRCVPSGRLGRLSQ